MASTVFDSSLFRDMFGTAEMRDVFSDEALVGRYLETEAALARAQARMGVVPTDAAKAIDDKPLKTSFVVVGGTRFDKPAIATSTGQ